MDKEGSVQRFLDLIRRSHRGKFKIYIGMSAGVGKSYRMLQEAHQLLDAGVDVCIGFIETHGRAETEALVAGLPLVPRRRLFYKGKELEEMDTQATTDTAVTSSARTPKMMAEATTQGHRATITLAIRLWVVSSLRTCGEAETISFVSITYCLLF